MDEIFDDADYLPKILFSGSPAPVPVTEIEIFEFVAGRPPDGYVFGRDAGVPVKSGQSVGHDLLNDVPVFEFVENSPQAAVRVVAPGIEGEKIQLSRNEMEILDRHSRCRSVLFLFDQKFFETTGVHAHVTQERIVVEAVFRKYVFQPNLFVTFVVPSRFVKLCCKVLDFFCSD